MKFQISNFKFQIVAALACLAAGAAENPAPAVERHLEAINKPTRLALPLPPLAEIKANDATGKTWQQNGTLPGALDVAASDMRRALRSKGWVLDKTIAVGKPVLRSELMIWTRPHHRVLMMVWEIDPGCCGFSWGEEK